MPEETFNLNQLTKEMIAKRLAEMEDPMDAMAEIVEKALYAALRGAGAFGPREKMLVVETCHGALTAVLLRERNLCQGAVRIIQAVVSVAGRLNLDATDTIKHALIGLARIRKVLTREQLYAIGNAIQEAYMGAGDFFRAEIALDPTEPIRPLNRKSPAF